MSRCKRFISAFLAIVFCIGILPINGMTADNYDELGHFTKHNTYTDYIFTDIQETDWFYGNVKSVYEYDLMRGKCDGIFAPESGVTLAETVTIAARIHALYYIGMDVFDESEPWYQTYVEYAEANGIVNEIVDDYSVPATRGEFANILANALPDFALEEINMVSYSGIPDVSLSDSYGRAVYKLYRAGIMIGNDEIGSFAPESNIRRCEVAAIITRMINPEVRKSVQLGQQFTVSFDLCYHGLKLDNQMVVQGYTAEEPKEPSRRNYIFDGWYTAKNGGYRFAFETEILSDVTLYARWKVDPSWYASIMNSIINGDKYAGDKSEESEKPETPDDSEDDYDYGSLPYRSEKTWEELTELNDGEEPYIELNDDNQVGLYIGKISDNKVNDVYDVIAELNNVRGLLNINDARFEFIPCYEDGKIDENSYRVQQVHNGVQVWCAQIVVIVDDDGYINGFTSNYVDAARFASVGTTASINAEQAVRIVQEDVLKKGYIVDNCTATITLMPDIDCLLWVIPANYNGKSYSYYVDAINGKIFGCIENVDQADTFDWTGITDNQVANEKFAFWGTNVNLTKISTRNSTNQNSYLLIDRSFYDKHLSNNPKYYGVYVYNNGNIDWDMNDKLPGVIIKRNDNEWNLDTYNERAGLYAIYNFKRVMETYSNIGFTFTNLPIEINVNIKDSNAAYCAQKNNNYVRFKFGRTINMVNFQTVIDPIRNLDTVGHEYTHMVQDYYVNPVTIDGVDVSNPNLGGLSLGSGYIMVKRDSSGNPEMNEDGHIISIAPNSSNIKWVEAKGISEGTADIMGMLVEAICEKIDVRSDVFWLYGENEKNEVVYKFLTEEVIFGRDYGGNEKTYDGHYSVREMNEFYKGTEFEYQETGEAVKYGVGYNETPILIGILRYIINNEKNITANELLRLWYTAITMLNAKSEFDSLRFSLIAAAEKIGLSSYVDAIIDACDSVGITGTQHAYEDYKNWFDKGLEKAYNNNIIAKENNINNIVTRREYLDLLAKMCKNVGVDVKVDVVEWAKNLQVIGDTWTDEYLSQSIPRWQAALLMYQIFNHYSKEFNDNGCNVIYGYEFVTESGTDHWQNFKNVNFNDWGKGVTGIDIGEMVQYYKGCAKYNVVTKEISIDDSIKAFQEQYMSSKSESKTYVSGKNDEDTRQAMYYMGFYQLWLNGMFNGYSSSGKVLLGTTDSISLGEACALITQVIPD